jgi:hypothetical protein
MALIISGHGHAAISCSLSTSHNTTFLQKSVIGRRRAVVHQGQGRNSAGIVQCKISGDEGSSSSWSPADLVKLVGQNVWGRSLPPGALVAVVRDVWTMGWLTMMAQLAPPSESKEYKRPTSQFRRRVSSSSAKSGQFHLYVALACPWAHR